MRALTDTEQGVMRLARLSVDRDVLLCRCTCLRSPWGLTAALHSSQTTTMKGSVSGRIPYSPISTPGIRMTWPRLPLVEGGLRSEGARRG